MFDGMGSWEVLDGTFLKGSVVGWETRWLNWASNYGVFNQHVVPQFTIQQFRESLQRSWECCFLSERGASLILSWMHTMTLPWDTNQKSGSAPLSSSSVSSGADTLFSLSQTLPVAGCICISASIITSVPKSITWQVRDNCRTVVEQLS